MTLTEKRLDARARRAARRVGLVARKSRWRHPIQNCGGFMLVEPSRNIPVAGFQYDLEPEAVIAIAWMIERRPPGGKRKGGVCCRESFATSDKTGDYKKVGISSREVVKLELGQ
jgi:hypothetical protein